MAKISWQDQLAAFKADNPDLPKGTDPVEEPETPAPMRRKDRLTASIERKGRAGKTVTRIAGFTLGADETAALAADLKRSLGTGGSVEADGSIIIQGDRREQAVAWLVKAGYNARKV